MNDTSNVGEPVLRGAPILGCLPELRRDRLGLLLRAYREGGGFVRLQLPGRRLYVATSPESATEVLRGQADKFRKFFALSELSRPFLGGVQLITTGGDKHLMRHLADPAGVAAQIDAARRG